MIHCSLQRACPLSDRAERRSPDSSHEGSVPPFTRTIRRLTARSGSVAIASNTALDLYVEGVVAGNAAALDVLQPHEVNWLRLFIGKAQCVSCTTAPC